MPNEWQRVNVGDLLNRGVLFIGDGYRAKNVEFGPTGLPLARVGHIGADGELDLRGADLFPEKDLHKVGNKISLTNDIAFTSKGTVGRFIFVREDTPRFVYSPQVSFWRVVNRTEIEPRFLIFWMRSREFIEQVHGLKGQTDMADYVSLNDQRRMTITLPPLPTQRRIAEILGRLDDKIEVNRRINRTLERMAQALYKHWFVDFGPFQDGEFVESEVGLAPKGWEVVCLRDIAQVNAASIRKGSEPNEIVYVDISSVSPGKIDVYTPMRFADAPSRARRLVKDGDIIWSAVRPNRRAFALIQHPVSNLVVSTGFVVITPVRVPYSYLYQALATQEFTDYLETRATGAAYPAVRPEDFESVQFLLPPSSLLDAFHKQVEPWLEQQYVLWLESTHLSATRDYLLPRLLAGDGFRAIDRV